VIRRECSSIRATSSCCCRCDGRQSVNRQVVASRFGGISRPDFAFLCFLRSSRCPAKNRAGPKMKKRDGGERNSPSFSPFFDDAISTAERRDCFNRRVVTVRLKLYSFVGFTESSILSVC
jgi:hypothetical protein